MVQYLYVFNVDNTHKIRIYTFMRYISPKKSKSPLPPHTTRPGPWRGFHADSGDLPPEPVSDLPDDDWDAWLAGAGEFPGHFDVDGEIGA